MKTVPRLAESTGPARAAADGMILCASKIVRRRALSIFLASISASGSEVPSWSRPCRGLRERRASMALSTCAIMSDNSHELCEA
jgi:hypothetical protein